MALEEREEKQTSTHVHWHLVARGGDLIALVYPGMRLGEDADGCFSLEPADAMVELGVEHDFLTVRLLPRPGEPEAPPVYVNAATRLRISFPNEAFVIDPKWAMDQSGADVSDTIEIQVRPQPRAVHNVPAAAVGGWRERVLRVRDLLPLPAGSSTDYVFGGLAVVLVVMIAAVLLLNETVPEPASTPAPDVVAAPAEVTAIEETSTSLEPAEPQTIVPDEIVSAAPEPVAAASAPLAALGVAEEDEASVRLAVSEPEAADPELTTAVVEETPASPEVQQVVETTEIVQMVSSSEDEILNAPEVAQSVDTPEVAEIVGTPEIAEIADTSEELEVVETSEAIALIGAAEAAEMTDAPELVDAAEVAESVDAPEVAEMVGPPEVAEMVGIPEVAEIVEAPEATQTEDVQEVSLALDAPELAQTVNAPELAPTVEPPPQLSLEESAADTRTQPPFSEEDPRVVDTEVALTPVSTLAQDDEVATTDLSRTDGFVTEPGILPQLEGDVAADENSVTAPELAAVPELGDAPLGIAPDLALLQPSETATAPAPAPNVPPVPQTATDDAERALYPYSNLTVVRQRPPIFPRTAPPGASGFVDLEFTVTERGRVADLQVQGDPPAYFARSAKNAVSNWRFKAVEVDGKRVPVRTRLRLTFRG